MTPTSPIGGSRLPRLRGFLASVPDETFDVILDDGCGRDAVGVRAIRTLNAAGSSSGTTIRPLMAPL